MKIKRVLILFFHKFANSFKGQWVFGTASGGIASREWYQLNRATMLLKNIKDLLVKAQSSNGEERVSYIQKVQNIIWDDETIQDESVNDILTDIAYILDFYEPNKEWRKEDPSYYGEERLEREIKSAIIKLKKQTS